MAGAFKLLDKKRKLIFWGHALSGVRVQRVQKVQRGRLTGLRPEGCGRLSAAGCVRWRSGGDSACGAEDCGIAPWAMSIKSALRDWLYRSYGMIRILVIGSLRSPTPIRLRRTSPASGGRIKHRETLSS